MSLFPESLTGSGSWLLRQPTPSLSPVSAPVLAPMVQEVQKLQGTLTLPLLPLPAPHAPICLRPQPPLGRLDQALLALPRPPAAHRDPPPCAGAARPPAEQEHDILPSDGGADICSDFFKTLPSAPGRLLPMSSPAPGGQSPWASHREGDLIHRPLPDTHKDRGTLDPQNNSFSNGHWAQRPWRSPGRCLGTAGTYE